MSHRPRTPHLQGDSGPPGCSRHQPVRYECGRRTPRRPSAAVLAPCERRPFWTDWACGLSSAPLLEPACSRAREEAVEPRLAIAGDAATCRERQPIAPNACHFATTDGAGTCLLPCLIPARPTGTPWTGGVRIDTTHPNRTVRPKPAPAHRPAQVPGCARPRTPPAGDHPLRPALHPRQSPVFWALVGNSGAELLHSVDHLRRWARNRLPAAAEPADQPG